MALSDVRVPTAKVSPALLKTRAERIKYVVKLRGTTLGKVERALRFSDGQLSRYTTGKRGGSTIDVGKMKALAHHLDVAFDWLVSGDGPMLPGGRGMTPFEEATALARLSETPEEVLHAAWARFQDRTDTMTALDWAAAIHAENQLSARAAVQRVERLGAAVRPTGVDEPRPKMLPPRRPAGDR